MTPFWSPRPLSRRDVLKSASCGFGYLALAALANEAAADYENPLAPRTPHFTPRAQRVIFLCMLGGPSQVDTFDYKPQLQADDGKEGPPDSRKGKTRTLLKSPWSFRQYGAGGIWISELYPHLARQADRVCMLNGMHTDVPNHAQAVLQLHTGTFQFVRPSVGSWVLYGLGSENENLPGFITLNPTALMGGVQNYGSAFLPAAFQGTRIGGEGERFANARVEHIVNALGTSELQRQQLDLLQAMNRDRLDRDRHNSELEGVIESYELAFRMQTQVPHLMDLSGETQETLDLYGIGQKATDDFGRQCLLARRFAEAGVRFVQLTSPGWDHHGAIRMNLASKARQTDQPIAALLEDLARRGLLEDTLVVWGGEFGRTPGLQGTTRDTSDDKLGRDHNSTGFTMWAAGGGVQGGLRYGATDEYGIAAVENRVHIHDLHATILALLGLDHTRLTYRYSGRDFRLTDVYGTVVNDIMA